MVRWALNQLAWGHTDHRSRKARWTRTAPTGDISEISNSWWGRVALAGHMTTRMLNQATVLQMCTCFVYVKKKEKTVNNGVPHLLGKSPILNAFWLWVFFFFFKQCRGRCPSWRLSSPVVTPYLYCVSNSGTQPCCTTPRVLLPAPWLRRAVLALSDVSHTVGDLHNDAVQGFGQADLATQTGPENVKKQQQKLFKYL